MVLRVMFRLYDKFGEGRCLSNTLGFDSYGIETFVRKQQSREVMSEQRTQALTTKPAFLPGQFLDRMCKLRHFPDRI